MLIFKEVVEYIKKYDIFKKYVYLILLFLKSKLDDYLLIIKFIYIDIKDNF